MLCIRTEHEMKTGSVTHNVLYIHVDEMAVESNAVGENTEL